MGSTKRVNYRRLFTDLLLEKYPEKMASCQGLLAKEDLSGLDVIRLNEKIFGKANAGTDTDRSNQKHRSYNKETIYLMLDYQKKQRLNNSQLAAHFKLSRNTVAKWKKLFL